MKFIADSIERVDKFIADQLEEVSRSQIQELFKSNDVFINDKPAKKQSVKLKVGDVVLVSKKGIAELNKEFELEPELGIPLDILYEDDDILVINKQADLIVHPTTSEPNHTLANAIIAQYPELKDVGESPFRPGIVHRLDRNTTGVLIIVKNQKTFDFIKEQFLNHSIKKIYIALVHGVFKDKDGVINYSIRPSSINRLKKVIVKDINKEEDKRSIREAETAYKVKESIEEKYSLLEVYPKTGRTHQIRVHLAAIGHPVVGDELYGSRTNLTNRQMLHAKSIEFIAPNGKEMKIEAPIPEDMQDVIKKAN
ncbi:RluA family pseudouridine synthase [Candidatus Wolfebacteria bacterium]|nr:RluA family pseudouridine synthase [Candidatus Wolfebacteria bacterium]